MTPAQAERVAVMLQQDRDAVERVARLQAELQRTRANIRTMEMRLHASAQEEATHRNKGNEAVSQAMEAVLTAKSFLDDSGEGGGAGGDGQGAGPPAPVIVATIGNGVPVLDANTAGKMRLWYQAEIDRLTHQVTRLEAELERRDEALDQLRRQVHDLKNGYSTERSELQLRITRGKLELDERVESLSSEHRRKLAAKDEEVKRNIDEMRISTSNQARELVRRTRGMVVCERVVRRLYQRRMWQAWASWVKFAFDHVRTAPSQLCCCVSLSLLWIGWRRGWCGLPCAPSHATDCLAGAQASQDAVPAASDDEWAHAHGVAQVAGACVDAACRAGAPAHDACPQADDELPEGARDRQAGGNVEEDAAAAVRSRDEPVEGLCGGSAEEPGRDTRPRVPHAALHPAPHERQGASAAPSQAPRREPRGWWSAPHVTVLAACLLGCLVLPTAQLLAGMNRWKLFVFYCKQAEMGQQIVEMEEKVDQAKKNAQDILENAAAKVRARVRLGGGGGARTALEPACAVAWPPRDDTCSQPRRLLRLRPCLAGGGGDEAARRRHPRGAQAAGQARRAGAGQGVRAGASAGAAARR